MCGGFPHSIYSMSKWILCCFCVIVNSPVYSSHASLLLLLPFLAKQTQTKYHKVLLVPPSQLHGNSDIHMYLFFPPRGQIWGVECQGKKIGRILELAGLSAFPLLPVHVPPPLLLTLLSHSCPLSSALPRIAGFGPGTLESADSGVRHTLTDWSA